MNATQHQFEIKKLKGFDGNDGPAYSCELWIDGQKAAQVIQSGNGGMTDFHFTDPRFERILNEHVDALPLEPVTEDWEKRMWPEGRKLDVDGFVAGLCDDFENDQKIRKQCRTKTVFRLVSDDEAVYSVPVPYSKQVVEKLKVRHGRDLSEILNENPKYASIERN